MTLEIGTRRGFLVGALALMTAPAIVRADSLMPVKFMDPYDTRCLIHYEIEWDRLALRVDRCLTRLPRPGGLREIPVKLAKQLMGPDCPIFTMKPYNRDTDVSRQVYAHKAISTAELMRRGITL